MADIEHKIGELWSIFPKKHTNWQTNEKSLINSTVFYSQYYDAKKCILLYPKYNLDIENMTLNKTDDNNKHTFSLLISTLDLHLDKDSGYRNYMSGLRDKVKSITKTL